jgi:putative Mg2+ transporter-C (MgtC) family protein
MDLTASAIIARIGLAALLGLLVGLDRQHLRKPAGMRTMLMVSFGACLFTLGGVRLAALGSSVGDGFNTDALSRVIQGIVAGIGFLGAGVILRDHGHIRGVTTAAGVWVTAGVGIACGLGEYLLASLSAVLAVAVFTSSRFLLYEGDGHNGAPDRGVDRDAPDAGDPPEA